MSITSENLNAFSDFRQNALSDMRKVAPDWKYYEKISGTLCSTILVFLPGIGIDGSLFSAAFEEIHSAHALLSEDKTPDFAKLKAIGMQAMFLAQRFLLVLCDFINKPKKLQSARTSVPSDEMTIQEIFAQMTLDKFPFKPKSFPALRTRIYKADVKPVKQGRVGAGNTSTYSYEAVKKLLSK